MNQFPWLSIIILFPLFAAFFIPLLPSRENQTVRWYTLGICLLDFLVMSYIFGYYYDFHNSSFQFKESIEWIPTIGFKWALGVDGLSMGLILLTGLVTTLAVLAAWPITCNPKLFYFLMLVMYSGQIGLFTSQDLFLFFLMWELELIPIYLLISLWGGRRRLYAATKFIFYTAIGSLFLFIATFTVCFYGANIATWHFEDLAEKEYPFILEKILYLGFGFAYAVKLPIIPFHTWLPDTHGEAHYSTCMLLAGILLKMGGYGWIRINMTLFPNAHAYFAPWLVILGTVQIIYAASVCLSQKNLKRRIAYSSISHMGFVLIGICSFTNIGLSGAICQMISHGLIGASLFFLAGTTYDRIRTVSLSEMGGIALKMPKMFSMFTGFSLASLALPTMSGFVAEMMIFLGIISSTFYSPSFRCFIILFQALGVILTPIYLLSMLRQMFYGVDTFHFESMSFIDSGPREVFIIVSLFIPVIIIGLYPNILLSIWQNALSIL
uniref:NAD(P)H-quinone oxidoreductase chain 4, chloroplastic n=1 Tax=Chara vulgaris TaxID=55564 RepID=NU4C_CHAVU|nr:NADH dehydrogenase subunit 4 [Chara vulgaris]Q1ACE9.1 RecName: Full=NAD(P)H-quinone oxidoreductase chain 4, chloroplastic; AltName: Full=NAD(P)H dehydrogenase, chain 4; AltName: Full=NADH-plastoquinone oxidoreductase chain 4 [Chara vulgaris]ABA61909.1 subunit 4 of NADH-plastoquinone oxidoreductase [Chara vulgaris]WAP91363.1 NADH dehydrogenase subunit 4 [Chara vulgaris]